MIISEGLPFDDTLPPNGWPLLEHLAFFSPSATNGSLGTGQAEAIRLALVNQEYTIPTRYIHEQAAPEHFAHVELPTLVTAHGGDGTARGVEAALLGIVPDDPEATLANYASFQYVAKRTLVMAGAGGNGNNLALSTNGDASKDPTLLKPGETVAKTCYPVRYEIRNEAGEHRLSNIAITGLGFGATAMTAAYLETKREQLRHQVASLRLGMEIGASAVGTLLSQSFSADVTISRGDVMSRFEAADLSVLEFMKSRIYAKQGRAGVNVDDTLWQPVILKAGANKLDRSINAGFFTARLSSARHLLKPVDMAGLVMSIFNSGEAAIPFHADGEVGPEHKPHVLNPGETLSMKLAKIGVQTVMQASPKNK